MNSDRLQIHARRDFWRPGQEIALHAAIFNEAGALSARVTNIELERIDADYMGAPCDSNPAFRLDDTAAQRLMDDLWNCGIRPTEIRGQSNTLSATQAHLKDMRQIVFHTNKIPQP